MRKILLGLALALFAFGAQAQSGIFGDPGVSSPNFSTGTAYNWSALQTFSGGISATAVNGGTPLFAARDDSGGTTNIVTAGTGYSSGDLLTVSGGTCTTQPVLAVFQTTGAVAGFIISNRGVCSVPPTNPVSVTGGSGTGATFNLQYSWLSTANSFAPFTASVQNGGMILGYNAGLNNQGPILGPTGYGWQCCGSGGNTLDGMGGGTGMTQASGENTFLGYLDGTQVTSGNWLTYVGHNVGSHETTGQFEVCLGTDSCKFLNAGSELAAVGRNTLKFTLNTANTVAIGSNAIAGGQFTSAVSGAANNGSGLCRVAVASTASMLTGDTAVVTGIAGATACNGVWPNVTIVDATHVDLTGSTFGSAYTSGGSLVDYASVALNETTVVGSGALGSTALRSVGDITASGFNALIALTTGSYDTSTGARSGTALTTGSQNVFNGAFAGATVTTAGGDVIVGYRADVTSATAGNAVIIGGIQAGGGNGARGTAGSTIVGAGAGNASMTGANHSLFGKGAGSNITSGTDDVVIGTGNAACAAPSASTSNSISICANSTSPSFLVTGANTPSTSATTVAGTIAVAGITTDATHTDATVCEDTTSHQFYFGSGTLGVCLGTSSLRYKTEWKPLGDGLQQVMALKPGNYFYKPGHGDNGAHEQYGFLAEDMIDVLPKLTGLDADGKPNSVDILGMVPVLVKAVQQQQSEIDAVAAHQDKNAADPLAPLQAKIDRQQLELAGMFVWCMFLTAGLAFRYRRP